MFPRPGGNITHCQSRNHNYKKDVHYNFQMCQWFLKPIGVWPLISKETSKPESITGIILMATCFSSLLFIILPSAHYIFFVEKSIHVKVKLFGPVGFCVFSTIKYCYLGWKGSSFERCIQHVKQDWKNVEDSSHRGIMLKYATISRKLIVVCAIFLFSGGMSYHTVVQFLSKERSRKNYTFKPLAYPGYDSFLDIRSTPTYEIVFSVHCLAAMIMYSVTTAAYSLAAVFVTHICGQIQIQISKLDELVKRRNLMKNDYNPLAVIVYDHVRVLRFSKDVEETLREICFTEIIESSLIMCLLEYYCLIEWKNSDTVAILTYATLLISFTFNIFIFCYIGEILTAQCSHIGTASYEIDWYNLPARRAYDLILVNAMSQSPPKLTAGKIIELSLSTFGAVVKTSVVYFNLLRTVTKW